MAARVVDVVARCDELLSAIKEDHSKASESLRELGSLLEESRILQIKERRAIHGCLIRHEVGELLVALAGEGLSAHIDGARGLLRVIHAWSVLLDAVTAIPGWDSSAFAESVVAALETLVASAKHAPADDGTGADWPARGPAALGPAARAHGLPTSELIKLGDDARARPACFERRRRSRAPSGSSTRLWTRTPAPAPAWAGRASGPASSAASRT